VIQSFHFFLRILSLNHDPDSSEDLDASVAALKLINPFTSITTQSLKSEVQRISKIKGMICFSRYEI